MFLNLSYHFFGTRRLVLGNHNFDPSFKKISSVILWGTKHNPRFEILIGNEQISIRKCFVGVQRLLYLFSQIHISIGQIGGCHPLPGSLRFRNTSYTADITGSIRIASTILSLDAPSRPSFGSCPRCLQHKRSLSLKSELSE